MDLDRLKNLTKDKEVPDPQLAKKAAALMESLCDTTNARYYKDTKNDDDDTPPSVRYAKIECTEGRIAQRTPKPTELIYRKANPFLYNKNAVLYVYDEGGIPPFLNGSYVKPIKDFDRKMSSIVNDMDLKTGKSGRYSDLNLAGNHAAHPDFFARPVDIIDEIADTTHFTYLSKKDKLVHEVVTYTVSFTTASLYSCYKNNKPHDREVITGSGRRENMAKKDGTDKVLAGVLLVDDCIDKDTLKIMDVAGSAHSVTDRIEIGEVAGELWKAYLDMRFCLFGREFVDTFIRWMNYGLDSRQYAVVDTKTSKDGKSKDKYKMINAKQVMMQGLSYGDFIGQHWHSTKNDFRAIVYTREFAKLARSSGCLGYSANESICQRLDGVTYRVPSVLFE